MLNYSETGETVCVGTRKSTERAKKKKKKKVDETGTLHPANSIDYLKGGLRLATPYNNGYWLDESIPDALG